MNSNAPDWFILPTRFLGISKSHFTRSNERIKGSRLAAYVAIVALLVPIVLTAYCLTYASMFPPITNVNASQVQASSASLAAARSSHTATLLANGSVLLIGGDSDGTVERLDPGAKSSLIVGSLSVLRSEHTATLLPDGRVLITGGRSEGNLSASTEIFDPTTGTSISGPPLNAARAAHTATVLPDEGVGIKILIAGGDTAGSAEVFDSASMRFIPTGTLAGGPRSQHSDVLLQNGKVLLTGGCDINGNALRSAEIFDTSGNEFSLTDDSMEETRVRPFLRLLPDGKVQVIGGNINGSIEIYDPLHDIFAARARVPSGSNDHSGLRAEILKSATRATLFYNGQSDALLDRTGHTITELPQSNRALVAGGKDSNGHALSIAYVLESSPAYVTTERLDYSPGVSVAVTGRGWLANEMVRLVFHEDPHTHVENEFTVQADASGSFIFNQYRPEEHDIGVSFILSASGLSSAWAAQTSFTDSVVPAVVISEFRTQGPAGANDEFVEIYNNSDSAIDVSGWKVRSSSSTGAVSTRLTIQSGTTLLARAHFLATHAGYTGIVTGDQTYSTGIANNGGIAVTLANDTVVDQVGMSAGSTFKEGTVLAQLSTSVNRSYERKGIGECGGVQDTGDNASDFQIITPSDPQNLSSAPLIDIVKPMINAPPDVSLALAPDAASCVALISDSILGFAEVSDTCSAVTISRSGIPAGNMFPVGITTITYTATDAAGNLESAIQTVVVSDNAPPKIVCPAEMNVAANVSNPCGALLNIDSPAATDNCAVVSVTGTRSDQRAIDAIYPQGATTIYWEAKDASGNKSSCLQTINVSIAPPLVGITGPPVGSVFPVGAQVEFTGDFIGNPAEIYSAEWVINGVSYTAAIESASDPSHRLTSLAHSFSSPGVYTVNLVVTSECGASGMAATIGGLTAMVVIFDPSAGFVTGGGWIESPPGAFAADPQLTGRANFGFVSKYKKGASLPTGETEFQFKMANLNFHASVYEWLVVSGARAQFKGTGTINGSGGFRFILTAIDGEVNGGGGTDRFRIKIWEMNSGAVVYDNQKGADDSASPTTALGGGSVVIRNK